MTICFFGNYQKDYPRNNTLVAGLRQNGVIVIECQTRETGIRKYWSLFKQHYKVKNQYDYLLVAFAGHALVWFAKLISRRPVIFDAFVSLYLTNVLDRENCQPKSWRARYYGWLDKISCELADHIFLDTKAQINFFINKYKLPPKKFTRLFVSANDQIFSPRENINIESSVVSRQSSDKFVVHWHGYLVPFNGFNVVLNTAKILTHENVEFRIITRFNEPYWQALANAQKLKLANLKFLPEMSYVAVADEIRAVDVCLGVFGNNEKAEAVIPNKIVESLAAAKPIITAETRATKELLVNNESVIFCRANDPADLAEKILTLKNNAVLREKIALAGHKIYQDRLTPRVVADDLLVALQNLFP